MIVVRTDGEGYAHLEECVRHDPAYMENRLKEFPKACNDPDAQKRQDAVRETYEEVGVQL